MAINSTKPDKAAKAADKAAKGKKDSAPAGTAGVVAVPLAVLSPLALKRAKALERIGKAYGKDIVVDGVIEIPRRATGLLGLDIILGGGVPMGRIIEVFGLESSGKTTLACLMANAFQTLDDLVAFIDAEQAIDTVFAKKVGMDTDIAVVIQPDNGEQALQVTCDLAEDGDVRYSIVDSVSALVPKAELEGDMGASHMGLQARLMGQALRKITGAANKNLNTIVFINQIRHKIGVMFGNPETTSGGNALKFYATTRLSVARIGAVKVGEVQVGNRVKIKAPKNKGGRPYIEREFTILFDSGYDRIGDLLDVAADYGSVDKAGSWYSVKGMKLGQGRENSIQALSQDKELCKTLLEETVDVLIAKKVLTESYRKTIPHTLRMMGLGEPLVPSDAVIEPTVLSPEEEAIIKETETNVEKLALEEGGTPETETEQNLEEVPA